ncbi:hypothetical protein C4579_02065 [Candidatus Microgenomates bacterium]|nr:MAG: hypothetical protein C4579_02065 [Candidatus Microgenomates bacterium]
MTEMYRQLLEIQGKNLRRRRLEATDPTSWGVFHSAVEAYDAVFQQVLKPFDSLRALAKDIWQKNRRLVVVDFMGTNAVPGIVGQHGKGISMAFTKPQLEGKLGAPVIAGDLFTHEPWSQLDQWLALPGRKYINLAVAKPGGGIKPSQIEKHPLLSFMLPRRIYRRLDPNNGFFITQLNVPHKFKGALFEWKDELEKNQIEVILDADAEIPIMKLIKSTHSPYNLPLPPIFLQ